MLYQLSYEATAVGSWSIMCSCVLVKEMNVIDVFEIMCAARAKLFIVFVVVGSLGS